MATPKSKTVGKEILPVASVAANEEKNHEKYYAAIGRRKSAIARVRIYTKKSTDEDNGEDHAMITVNQKDYSEYFVEKELQETVESPLKKLKSTSRFKATVRVSGGGIAGQADAIRHGLARALVSFDPNFAKKLKKS